MRARRISVSRAGGGANNATEKMCVCVRARATFGEGSEGGEVRDFRFLEEKSTESLRFSSLSVLNQLEIMPNEENSLKMKSGRRE